MINSEKNENIKKHSSKKSYRQPKLEGIGKISSRTKGANGAWNFDSSTRIPIPFTS